MSIANPFHDGEQLVQQRLGEVEIAQRNGRIIAEKIIPGALEFIKQQPMVVLGSVGDAYGNPSGQRQNVWASVLFGSPGFMTAVDQSTVEFDLNQAICNSLDPFWTNIKHNSQIGILIIELATRRRLRINGEVTPLSETRLRLNVSESYPNCPKYIQRRHITRNHKSTSPLKVARTGLTLSPEQSAFIATADTFLLPVPIQFVGLMHPIGVEILVSFEFWMIAPSAFPIMQATVCLTRWVTLWKIPTLV